MDKNKMLKQRMENYEKWFYRWIRNYNLKKQIKVANNKNYTCLNIPINEIENDRDKMMMLDDNFLNMLKKEFTDFNITRGKEVKDRYLLGRKIGQVEINTVYIDWS